MNLTDEQIRQKPDELRELSKAVTRARKLFNAEIMTLSELVNKSCDAYEAALSLQASEQEAVVISVPSSPKKIWLNIGDTDFEEVEREGWKWNDLSDVTWSEHKVDQCDIPYIRADLAFTSPPLTTEAEQRAASMPCGDEKYPLNAYIWRREYTQEWVLELSGTINGCCFTCRHTEPLSTPPEDVAELPSLHTSPPTEAELMRKCADVATAERKRIAAIYQERFDTFCSEMDGNMDWARLEGAVAVEQAILALLPEGSEILTASQIGLMNQPTTTDKEVK